MTEQQNRSFTKVKVIEVTSFSPDPPVGISFGDNTKGALSSTKNKNTIDLRNLLRDDSTFDSMRQFYEVDHYPNKSEKISKSPSQDKYASLEEEDIVSVSGIESQSHSEEETKQKDTSSYKKSCIANEKNENSHVSDLSVRSSSHFPTSRHRSPSPMRKARQQKLSAPSANSKYISQCPSNDSSVPSRASMNNSPAITMETKNRVSDLSVRSSSHFPTSRHRSPSPMRKTKPQKLSAPSANSNYISHCPSNDSSLPSRASMNNSPAITMETKNPTPRRRSFSPMRIAKKLSFSSSKKSNNYVSHCPSNDSSIASRASMKNSSAITVERKPSLSDSLSPSARKFMRSADIMRKYDDAVISNSDNNTINSRMSTSRTSHSVHKGHESADTMRHKYNDNMVRDSDDNTQHSRMSTSRASRSVNSEQKYHRSSDSVSQCSSRRSSPQSTKSEIEKWANIAVSTAISILKDGGTKETAKVACLAVLSTVKTGGATDMDDDSCSAFSTASSVVRDDLEESNVAAIAAEASLNILMAGMSHSSAVAVIVMIMADGSRSVCGNDDESRRTENSVAGNSIISSNTRDKRDDVREMPARKNGVRDMPAATEDIKELLGPNGSIHQNGSMNNETVETLSQQKKEHNMCENGNGTIAPLVSTQNSMKTITATKNISTCHDKNWPTVLDEDYGGCEGGCVYVPIVTQIGEVVEGTTDAVKNSLNELHSNIMSPENNVSEFWNNIESRIASLFQNNEQRNDNDMTIDKVDNDEKKVTRRTDIRLGAYDLAVAETSDDVEVTMTKFYEGDNESTKENDGKKKKKKRKSLYKNGKKIVKMVMPRVRSRQGSVSSKK